MRFCRTRHQEETAALAKGNPNSQTPLATAPAILNHSEWKPRAEGALYPPLHGWCMCEPPPAPVFPDQSIGHGNGSGMAEGAQGRHAGGQPHGPCPPGQHVPGYCGCAIGPKRGAAGASQKGPPISRNIAKVPGGGLECCLG